jgi:hypothetical protein
MVPGAGYTGKHRRVSRLGAAGPHAWGNSAPGWRGKVAPDAGPTPGGVPLPGPQDDDGQWPDAGQRADA